MKSKVLGVALATCLVVGVAMPALANPVQFSAIYFDYVSAPGISWDDANAASAATSFMTN